MTITAKFDLGDTVYVLTYGEIHEATVQKIIIRKEYKYSEPITTIEYVVEKCSGDVRHFPESGVFSTKKDAGNCWLKQQGVTV